MLQFVKFYKVVGHLVEYSGQEIVEHFIWLAFVSPAADSVPGRQKGVRQERAMAVCLLYAALHLGNHITARIPAHRHPKSSALSHSSC